MSFFESYGEVFNSRRGFVRDTVVAYVVDGIKQDKLIKLDAPISADLVVGSVVNASGALVSDAADAMYVVVEFARNGDSEIVVADPYMTILKKSGLVTAGASIDATLETLQAASYTFADYATVALRTT